MQLCLFLGEALLCRGKNVSRPYDVGQASAACHTAHGPGGGGSCMGAPLTSLVCGLPIVLSLAQHELLGSPPLPAMTAMWAFLSHPYRQAVWLSFLCM